MRKLWKKILAGVLVAGMMLAPVAGVGATVANAEDVLLIAPNPNASVTYDFTDGSIIPTDTNGKSDVTSGNLTVKVGTKNAYGYNGPDHGVQFKAGNTIEIKVDGPTKIEVGDCQFSAYEKLTMTSADGSWTQTVDAKKGCQHNDGSVVVFEYTGAANTLVLGFEGTCYIPKITTTPINMEPTGPVVTVYNFKDGSIVPTDTNGKSDVTSGDLTVKVGTKNAYGYNGPDHGVQFKAGNTIEIKVGGPVKIAVGDCQFSANDKLTMTSADGTWSQTADAKKGCEHNDGSVVVFEYNGDANTLVLGFEGTCYIPSITVTTVEKTIVGEAENFTFMYDEKAVDGVVATGLYKFADSELLLAGETVNGVITQYTVKSGKTITVNGKTYNAYTSGKRHADVNNIFTLPGEGDGCLTVFKPADKGMMTVYFNSTSFIRVHDFNNDGTKNGYVDAEVGITEYSFEVRPGHTYVMSTTGKTNNMFYAGYSYVVDEKVSVPVTVTNVNATVTDALEISLVDAQLGGKPIALKTAGDTLELLKGHTYRISTNDGGVKALVGESDTFVVSEEGVTVTLNNVPDLTLSGKIVGADASCVTKLTFTNAVNGTVYEATITNDTYTVSVKPGEYNTGVETTNGAVTFDRASVQEGRENTNDVYLEVSDPTAKREISYTDIENLEKTGNVAVESGKAHCVGRADSTVTIPVSGRAKIVVNAYYAADFTINGEQKIVNSGTTATIDSFEQVVDGDVTIAFNATSYLTSISIVPLVEFKSELNVPGDYATLNEASDAILGMADRPEGEAGRVTINLTADLFEQVVMKAPYVTLKGNGHTISWYYGVGTLYYSVDPATGFYNKRLAMDKYSYAEGNGNLWGGVFIVQGDNFIAEDTTFKNTYNYELTEAEKTDIAGSALNVDRLAEGADVTTHAYKERSNAFYIDADNIEVYNCKILSSQDTLGRNGSSDLGYHAYFKNCVIGGNTDYICGEFAAVFDNCELQWKTYSNDNSNNAKIGYIVAPKTNPYVFRNCTITTDGNAGEATVLGKLGRTWGANSNASFINVETNGLIDAEGWGEMNSGDKATAVFNEYNITSNGQAYSSTGATNHTLEAVANYIDTATVSVSNTVLDSWVPVHYGFDLGEGIEKTTDGRAVYSGETIYIVKKGDSLWSIAKQLFGKGAKYKELFARNSDIIEKAELIFRGQEIIVPKLGVVVPKEEKKVEDIDVDLSAGLKAGTDYNGISVLEDFSVKEDPQEIGGASYTYAVFGSSNASPKSGAVPEQGAAVKVVPAADGTFTIVFKLNAGKQAYVVDGEANVIEYIEASENSYLTKTYKVEAGKVYYFYGQGTKPYIYKLSIEY